MQGNYEGKSRLKVCFIITKGIWGGAQKYVYELATNLSKSDYDVSVITGEGQALTEKLNDKEIRTYTLEALKRDVSLKEEIKSFFSLVKIIRKESPEVLHLNSPKAGGLGALAGRIVGVKKIIYTAHGWTFNEYRGATSTLAISFFTWITVILCHKVIVIADRERKQALAMPFINHKKIVLINNGLEKINFKEKEESRKELLSKVIGKKETIENAIWLGTISELHRNKGLKYAIESLKRISFPFLFFIIGEGEQRKYLEEIIKKNNLEGKVFLVGFVSNASEYLKAFDIYICSSIKEGLPYSILEAGQAGLPVIASSVGGIPDIVENSTSGILVSREKPGEITRALEYLITNPEKQKIFGENLKTKVEKNFSIEEMLSKTFQLYN